MPANRCAQCQLPIRGRPLQLHTGERREPFCCYGCYLVLRLTRERGPGGEAQAVAVRLGLAVFFAMNAMMFSLPGYFPYLYGGGDGDGAAFLLWLRVLAMGLTLPVLLLLGVPVLWQAARDAAALVVRSDALVALGGLAAYAVSIHHTITGAAHVYFDTVALLLVFVALGRYLEARAKAETGRVLTQLRERVAPRVRVRRDGAWATVGVPDVTRGDVFSLGPGDTCPSDGVISLGEAHFDESTLTGESRPVRKAPGATVLAGSANLDGHVEVRATAVGDASSLGQLARRVEEALADRSGFQRLADRLAGILVFLVPILALLTFWYWSRHDASERGLLAALAVLVVACPCAFGIATPAALWVGVAAAAGRGVLLRSAATLEALSRVRTVWFDKTGTLSSGRLELTGITNIGFRISDSEPEMPHSTIRNPQSAIRQGGELIAVARALEAGVPHPIAKALTLPASGEACTHFVASRVRYRPGLGVEGEIDGKRWFLGSLDFLSQNGAAHPPWAEEILRVPSTAALSVALGSESEDGGVHLEAILNFNDPPRSEATATLRQLRRMGLGVGVLTGCARLGDEWDPPLAMTECHSGLSPEDKVDRLRSTGARGLVAMVGDGLNDAPALAAADVGIALGTGKDLTREAAQVNVLSDDLALVPWIFAWSRQVHRTMVQNLSWALFYNTVALAAAASGWLNPVIAAGAMIASSVLIVANAQRLRQRVDLVAEVGPHGSRQRAVRDPATVPS
jgi:heavy metal translocating P-type ATPase